MREEEDGWRELKESILKFARSMHFKRIGNNMEKGKGSKGWKGRDEKVIS